MVRRLYGFAVYYVSFFYYLILLPRLFPGETEIQFRSRLRRAIRRTLRAFGVEVVVTGMQHFRPQGNAIIVANHSSWFDQLALLAALEQPLTFMANRKYFRYFGLATVLRKLGCVPTAPDSAKASLQAAREQLAKGRWLVVYPEGTRSCHCLPFRRGAALLAEQAQLPLQPIVIHGADKVLPRRHSFLAVQPGLIELEVHPCVACGPSNHKEFMSHLRDFYQDAQLQNTNTPRPAIASPRPCSDS